jgi:hypothetical protein
LATLTQVFEEAASRIIQKEKLSKKAKKSQSNKQVKDSNFELPNLNYNKKETKGGCCGN